jgi:hypothetical protein
MESLCRGLKGQRLLCEGFEKNVMQALVLWTGELEHMKEMASQGPTENCHTLSIMLFVESDMASCRRMDDAT